MIKYLLLLIVAFCFIKCSPSKSTAKKQGDIQFGAERLNEYKELLVGKRVALLVNQSSRIGATHLLDSLLSIGINVEKIFSPEHGFRGNADAGAHIDNAKDNKTGLPIISLYGNHKKPTKTDLANIDILVFDIQDVGARFYTYISTMHYAMEACAENKVQFLVLDRPNPNGHYVDGPVLEVPFKSFVGMHNVPIVHGMTVAEYAQMINGQYYLKDSLQCDLQYVKCENYDHNSFYQLPVKPSPNLPNALAVYLYPSLCLFEGTVISVGRGTNKPFQIFGHPDFEGIYDYSFTPESKEGATHPKLEGTKCFGKDLSVLQKQGIMKTIKLNLTWIVEAYKNSKDKAGFFTPFFTKLAGTEKLQKQIEQGMSAKAIKLTWKEDLTQFQQIRKKYLLYKDFKQ